MSHKPNNDKNRHLNCVGAVEWRQRCDYPRAAALQDLRKTRRRNSGKLGLEGPETNAGITPFN
eukprot:413312-Lingulodinium_polyedra.AAC.1